MDYISELYSVMESEYRKYLERLWNYSPQYVAMCANDIFHLASFLDAFETADITQDDAKAMLALIENPLMYMYKDWLLHENAEIDKSCYVKKLNDLTREYGTIYKKLLKQ